MTKKISLILGNGFTIDFLKYISTDTHDLTKSINVTNIFADGGALRWPLDGRPGFLSYKHCPNLWGVGARSFLSSAASIEILERVVTCANVYSLKRTEVLGDKTGNGFLHAYKELVSYLKYLFIHYNKQVATLPANIGEWSWSKFLLQLNSDPEIEEVIVISYNYDIWFERILEELKIEFEVPLLNKNPIALF